MISVSYKVALTSRERAAVKKATTMLERSKALRSFRRFPKEIEVLFVLPAFSKKLNRLYRKKNKAANVLTFVYDGEYAEIFITPAVVRKQAREQGEYSPKTLVKMLIHGIIHCSGVDHEASPAEERAFEKREKWLIAASGW